MLPRRSELQDICRKGYEDYDKQVQKDIEKRYVELMERAQLAEVSLQETTKDLHLAKDKVQAAILAQVQEEMAKMAEEQNKATEEVLHAQILQTVLQENAKLTVEHQGQVKEQIATQVAALQTAAAAEAIKSNEQTQQDNANSQNTDNVNTAGDTPQPDSEPEVDNSYGGYIQLQLREKAIAATVDTEMHRMLTENNFLLKKHFETKLEAIKWLEEEEPPNDGAQGTDSKKDDDQPSLDRDKPHRDREPSRDC